MPDILKKSEEEEHLDEYVLLAGIAINHENYLPLPPKTPKSPKTPKTPVEVSEKLS